MNTARAATALRELAAALEEPAPALPAIAAQSPADGPLLLTIQQACEELGVGETFLRTELLDTGRLASLRLAGGRAVRIPRRALEALIAEGLAEAMAERERVIGRLHSKREYRRSAAS